MKYCLIGEKLGHSYSAEIHSQNGLDYALKEIRREQIADFIGQGYDGFNITIPYKKDIIPYLVGVSDAAKNIGAVNTAVKVKGGYYGYNTDIVGLEYVLSRKGISLKNKRVAVLGSGGAAATANALCAAQGAKSAITVSRSGEINYRNCYDHTDTQIVINATPVGMFPNMGKSPVDLSRFYNLEGAVDCVYNPFRTRFILQAQKLGVVCSDGLPMLVKQALAAEELWGVATKECDCENIIGALYRKKVNAVLIGMPSAGKTAVAEILGKILGRTVIDTDEEVYKATGKTPAEIITERGEPAFRWAETAAVKTAAAKSGVIIATGGGAVLKEENTLALAANGLCFWVKRDLSLLSDKGRPLSKGKSAERLFEERKEFYERAADFTVENDTTPQDCAEKIAEIFRKAEINPKTAKS